MKYGRALRILRSVRGLSQKDLAELVNVDASYFSRVESEQRIPSVAVLDAVARELRVPMYLIAFLATEQEDLRGVREEQAQEFGRALVDLFAGRDSE